MKKLFLMVAAISTSVLLNAQATALAGTYIVGGEGADYATLADACTAVNAATITGDVTLAIAADLTETVNSGIINTSDYTITIRPDKDEPRTITFTATKDNTGPSGSIVIGCKMTLVHADAVATKNVVIDGCAENSETPNLTLVHNNIGGRVVVYGPADADGVTENITIQNLKVTKSRYSIECRKHSTSGVLPQNILIKNNVLVAYDRNIHVNGAKDITIEGNTFTLEASNTGNVFYGIMGSNSKGTMIVRGNKFLKVENQKCTSTDEGIVAIGSSFADNWIIENNTFAGLDVLAENSEARAMYIRSAKPTIVRHNTFYVPSFTQKPITALMSGNPIACVYIPASTLTLENNIFVCEETEANVSLIRGALSEGSKNNVFYHKGGNAAIVAAATPAADWAAYETNYSSTNPAVWAEVHFTDAAAGDLSLTGASDGDKKLGVPFLADVPTDITGKDRDKELTYAGAFEGKSLTAEGGDPTALENAAVEKTSVRKVLENGRLVIIRDGVRYNAMGMRIE